MTETTVNNIPSSEGTRSDSKINLSSKISFWIGILGSIITLSLTVWNTHTKTQIDKREEDLKALEITLKERSTGVEESKERVERYKWVLSLFPTLNSSDEKEIKFTLNLIRLALTKEEAEQLFTGLQTSSDTTLQSLGQNGINAIQNEPIAQLISEMNASTADQRKKAVATLINEYKSFPQAITLALGMYNQDKLKSLSPSGIINGLVFLNATDPSSWNKKQIADANDLIRRIRNNSPGPQTTTQINNLEALLQKVE